MSLETQSRPFDDDPQHGLGPLHSNEIIIGLALGSPREVPDSSVPQECLEEYPSSSRLPQAGHGDDDWDNVSYQLTPSPPQPFARSYPAESGLKRSGSRWKNIGSLFSRKAPSAPGFDGQPFYMLDHPNEENQEAHTARTLPPAGCSAAPRPTRKTTPAMESTTKTAPSLEPVYEGGARALLRRASTRRKAIRKRARAYTGGSLESNRNPPARVRLNDRKADGPPLDASTWLETNDSENQKTVAGAPSLSTRSPFLQIEIPGVELERYSVMFGDLLPSNSAKLHQLRSSRAHSQRPEPRPAPTGKENKPDGLKFSPLSSNPPLLSNPSRPVHSRKDSSSSTGSKSSGKSANYGLFPSTYSPKKRTTTHKSLSKPSPLSRSVTAPNTMATSLARPVPKSSKSQGPEDITLEAQAMDVPSLPKGEVVERDRQHHHRHTSSLNPSDISTSFSPSRAEFGDYVYDDDDDDDHLRPSSAKEARNEKPTSCGFPVRKSSMRAPKVSPIMPRAHPPRTSSKPPSNDDEPPPPLEGAGATEGGNGEMAIARQISISRQQRNLVPIVPQIVRRPVQVDLVEKTPSGRTCESSFDF